MEEKKQLKASPEHQEKLLNALGKFFECTELSELLEVNTDFINAYLEQGNQVSINKIDDANHVFQMNQQSSFIAKLYGLYRDMKE